MKESHKVVRLGEDTLLGRLTLQQLENQAAQLRAELVGLRGLMLLRVLQKGCCRVHRRKHYQRLRVLLELHVLDGHLNQHHRHLRDQFHKFVLVLANVFGQLSMELVRVSLVEIEVSNKVNLEVEHSKELRLFLQDVSRRNGFVSYLFGHDLGVKWEDIFVLGSQVHRGHSYAVHIFILESFPRELLPRQEFVEHLCGQEVGPGRALEGSANFDHPVHHFGSVFLGHLVASIGCVNSMIGAPLLKADLYGVLLKLFLLEALVVVLEECIIQFSFFDVLLH